MSNQDFEVPEKYQNWSWVIFADPKSLERIPEKGFEFSIPASGVDKEVHELSLEDLEDVAREADYEAGFDLRSADRTEHQRVIGGTIRRSGLKAIPS